MKYYVDGKTISIPKNKKVFGRGSEGKLYQIEDKLYKIYYSNALNEGFGEKEKFHKSLLGISDEFEKFVLLDNLIFDEAGKYCGYVTRIVGDGSKEKDGVTSVSWEKFVSNLRDIEKELDKLSENRFLAIDMDLHNSIFDKNSGNLYMVDPGRYHRQPLFTLDDYIFRNRLMLEDFFFHMLQEEAINFKLTKPNKAHQLIRTIKDEKKNASYSEYFEQIKDQDKFESVHEFLKQKAKYLR